MESSPGAPAQCRTGSSPLSSPVRHTDYTYPYLSTDRPWHGPHREHYLHSKKYLKLRQQVAALVSKPRRLTDDDARPAVLSPASCSIRPETLHSRRAERRLMKGAAGAAEAGLVADRLSQFLDSEMPATPSPPSRRPARPVLTRRPITAPESPRLIPTMKLVDLGSPRSEPLLPSLGSPRRNSVPTAEPTDPMPKKLSSELSRRRLLARKEVTLAPFVDSTVSLPFEGKPPTVLFTKACGRRAAKQKPVEPPVRAMRPLNPPVPTRHRSVGGDSLRSSELHRSSAHAIKNCVYDREL